MTTEEKRHCLKVFCFENDCDTCLLSECPNCGTNEFDAMNDDEVDVCYNRAFVGKEEINHPDRYAGGKFECIDVMLDVFGADAVKHFCILNAFKYLWRAEKKTVLRISKRRYGI